MAREGLVRRAVALSVVSIVLNGLAGGTAVVAGLTSGGLSLLGFGFDAAVDSAASIALVWRFGIEAREPQRADRAEKVAEGIVGGVLGLHAVGLHDRQNRRGWIGHKPGDILLPNIPGFDLLGVGDELTGAPGAGRLSDVRFGEQVFVVIHHPGDNF